ncbi:MAG: hypothetical protein ACREQ9_05915, partial [Candidatus Binatia bacterium]
LSGYEGLKGAHVKGVCTAVGLLIGLFGFSHAFAEDVRFSDTFAVTDTATGDHVLSSRLENRSDRGRDVYVTTPDGTTRKVGRLEPGERARVTAVPGFPGGGLFIFDRE